MKIKEKVFRGISFFVAEYILRKPDLADLIYIKYHSPNAIFKMAINYFTFRLRAKKSYKIVSLIIEPTNNCTLRCKVCPTRDNMTRKRGIMDFDLYKKIIDQNPNVSFIQLCLWGESLLHPQIINMIKYAKNKGIEVSFYSNATLLNKKMNHGLLTSGLDRIVFSLDGVDETYTKIRNFPYQKIEKNILSFLEDKKRLKSKTKVDVSMVICNETKSSLARFKKRWLPLADAVRVQPQNTYQKSERKKPCFELWRGNIIVLWDGAVVPCCVDFNGTLKLGDANKQTLKEIFNAPLFQKIRLTQKEGKFPEICHFCTEYQTEEASSRFN